VTEPPAARKRRGPAAFAVVAAGSAVLALLLAFLLPGIQAKRYYQNSLGRLQRQSRSIQREFSAVLKDQDRKLRRAAAGSWPVGSEEQFALFKSLGLDPRIEGIAVYGGGRKLDLWFGNVVNLEEAVPEGVTDSVIQQFGQTLLIKDKASSYLVSLHWVNSETLLVLTRLLAFIPQFKSPYLGETHFLSPGLRRNCDITYFDFREDVGGYETFFTRHRDEYVGQPRLQGDVLSFFVPLRNERNQILATLTLRSLSQSAFKLGRRDLFLEAAHLFLALGLVLLLAVLVRRCASSARFCPGPAAAALGVVAGLRVLLLSLSGFAPFRDWPFFSPTVCGFLSLGDLTKSPADILFTAAAIFLLALGAALLVRRSGRPRSRGGAAARLAGAFVAAAASMAFVQLFASRLTANASLNLLRFDLTGAFLALHLSLVLVGAAAAFFSFLWLREALTDFRVPAGLPLICFAVVESAAFLLFGPGRLHPFLVQCAAVASLAAAAAIRKPALRRAILWAAVILQAGQIHAVVQRTDAIKQRTLIDQLLKHTTVSQEDWARVLMSESFREIDRQGATILAFLRRPEDAPDPARALWEKTPAAKFNWYSALEILDANDGLLARFALNVPRVFRMESGFAAGSEWTISRLAVPFLGKKKDFVVGQKEWLDGGRRLGRTVIYYSLDDAMLPFLYSANPYYEILRVHSLPSLEQFDIRMAVFDEDGRILFNPGRIATGLPASLVHFLDDAGEGRWARILDKGIRFDVFAFRSGPRIYAFLTPSLTWVRTATGALKLFLLYAAIFLLPLYAAHLLLGRERRHPLWSFANRVYISFAAVALIPLLLFTVFSQGFFSRMFAQQFVEKAESLASTARSVMDDFLQRQEQADVQAPPEDLMLWISTTIQNDVNLYREGRLVSSSRSEFFDAGMFPVLLDGEIYYRIQFENNPYYAQEQRIGQFAFRTLTIPYTAFGPRLMISLPFPFEREELAAATREVLELILVLSAVFFLTVIVLARGIGSMLVTPIRKLLDGTREASLGNLDFSLEYRRQDEMRTLFDGFNAMIRSLKDHQRELADLGKKAAWAEMARKVAHEIKNPLTPIQLSAEHLLRVFEDKREDFEPALRESLSYIVSEVENLRRIAQEFLETSRDAVQRREPLALDEIVRETVTPYQNLLSRRIAFRIEVEGSDFGLTGDRDKLKIALRNILTNAIESIRGKGSIDVRLASGSGQITLRISDTGVGIEKELLDRIFEPYFSTKDVGTGLGLPIAKKIVEDHGGAIEIASEPGRGTAITIRFRTA
jgi:signal transduction histidine kinase